MTISAINGKPAILGGPPQFAEWLPVVSPRLPDLDQVEDRVREILRTGNLTNHGRYVRELEVALARRLEVPYAITSANATLGLILALAGLHLEGEVILPSFTYCATAHVLIWNRLMPVFVDILPDTFTLDPAAVEAAITPRTSAILAVHIYGHPCEIDELKTVAARHSLALLFDAAHAFGARYRGQNIGQFGDAEVFSFHATKIFPVGEGGCVSTHNGELADYLIMARRFGDPGTENSRFPGLNAKMQEFNAILGLAALHTIDKHIANRHEYARYLIQRLGQLPGLKFQTIRPYVFTTYQNFAILVNRAAFGLSRDQLCMALAAENILARKYFYPPLHHHDAYKEHRSVSLPVTEQVAGQVLCLPFYSEMDQTLLDGICQAIERIHCHATAIRKELAEESP